MPERQRLAGCLDLVATPSPCCPDSRRDNGVTSEIKNGRTRVRPYIFFGSMEKKEDQQNRY